MAKKNVKKNKKRIDPTPHLTIGDHVKHPKFGVGVVKQYDTRMFPDYEFFYDVDFTGKGGDGTKVWLSKVKAEKLERITA